MSYEDYQQEWFGLPGQIEGFLGALSDSMKDSRTIAEIIETDDGQIVGYLWVPFFADDESGFFFADVSDIYVEDEFRTTRIATKLMEYAETNAKENGAKVIRSGTGCENKNSIGLHEKLGYYQYRYEFEKLL
jgi:ribosomal protein S18 acetylase RimI-like enzyme